MYVCLCAQSLLDFPTLLLLPAHPRAAMAMVDCHALFGLQISQEVRHRIADFVCGAPSPIPHAILDSCGNRQTILDAWPAVRCWELGETFGVECYSGVGGSVIRRYCIRTVLTVDLKIDPVSLDFLVGKELGGVIRVHEDGLALSGGVTQRVADDVEDGLLTRLYIRWICGDRYPSAAEFSANGVVDTEIQCAFAPELEEPPVMDEHDYENLALL